MVRRHAEYLYIRLKIAAVAATAAFMRPTLTGKWSAPPQDCRSRGDCGVAAGINPPAALDPPQDCRSRGDCGEAVNKWKADSSSRLKIAAVAATAATDLTGLGYSPDHRLKIAAVAATAGWSALISSTVIDAASRLPQSRRLRPMRTLPSSSATTRLKIAAVAATAATRPSTPAASRGSASRLPQSRRLRLGR